MKTLLTMMAAACMMVSCGAKNAEKTTIYEVEPFTVIQMDGVGEIIYTQGDVCTVKVEGDSIHIANTSVTVKDGKLQIRQIKDVKKSEGLTFYVTSPTLEKVSSAGVGSFKAPEAVKFGNDFFYEQEGVGAVKFEDLTCEDFRFNQEGVGAADIKVRCHDAWYVSEGVGAAEIEIEANKLELTSDGVGAVNVKGQVKEYTKKKSSIISAVKDKNLVVGK